MGLEVLGPEEAKLFGHHTPKSESDAGPPETDIAADDGKQEAQKKTKPNKRERAEEKRKHKRQKMSEAAVPGADEHAADNNTLAALTAKVAALQAENSALKSQDSPDQPKPKTKGKPAKAVKSAKTSVPEEAAAAVEPQASTEHVDMAAWAPFELHSKVEKAIALLGFRQPTPIQKECLPSAIRDRRDVVGAAQTVRVFLLTQTVA